MFSNKEKSNSSSTSASYSSSVNSIGEGTSVEGTINADSDIRIDGEIKGNLFCRGKLILGERGKIVGDIECNNALIEGEIRGKIVVKELLQVKDSAIIDGDIATDKLNVESGAVFNVSCNMGQTSSTSTMTTTKKNTPVLTTEEAA
ncbi:MAG: polymer-forming cytoskeletal protein [Saprospiraceae bacterium]|nr:polymer-forming cytoskeletal protein [Saprospiraceae bacterium]